MKIAFKSKLKFPAHYEHRTKSFVYTSRKYLGIFSQDGRTLYLHKGYKRKVLSISTTNDGSVVVINYGNVTTWIDFSKVDSPQIFSSPKGTFFGVPKVTGDRTVCRTRWDIWQIAVRTFAGSLCFHSTVPMLQAGSDLFSGHDYPVHFYKDMLVLWKQSRTGREVTVLRTNAQLAYEPFKVFRWECETQENHSASEPITCMQYLAHHTETHLLYLNLDTLQLVRGPSLVHWRKPFPLHSSSVSADGIHLVCEHEATLGSIRIDAVNIHPGKIVRRWSVLCALSPHARLTVRASGNAIVLTDLHSRKSFLCTANEI